MRTAITILVVSSISLVITGCDEATRMKEFHDTITRIERKVDSLEGAIDRQSKNLNLYVAADQEMYQAVGRLCDLLRGVLVRDELKKENKP